MTLDVAQQGLRERKRIATRRAIESAALSLVVEKGYENVTVDEISHRADVSPRTFFNYFTSKEGALLGEAPELPAADVVQAYVTGSGNALQGLGVLVAGATENDEGGDADTHTLRFSLMKQYPQLFALRMAAMKTFEAELTGVVADRLRHENPSLDDDTVRSRARLTTLVAFGAIRHAWASWAENEGAMPLSDRMAESFDQLPGILHSGTAA
jgi:AcrR family transcriptional regulator